MDEREQIVIISIVAALVSMITLILIFLFFLTDTINKNSVSVTYGISRTILITLSLLLMGFGVYGILLKKHKIMITIALVIYIFIFCILFFIR
jgi:hypothetical protein